ncbi:uncharacterized protein EV420DRAFT_1727301 [Desarmillaria tabescens]|uniref:NAD(P)-binding protein n=1 Tax=Armillaria tabescens TaxID=1929756 RepID=A0AA39JG95_ARMTA|nr:uncharacterized protein EV420DRAFT_1727301 [Desarmillaria tabescens]KAK0442236.1 hypothetical protein EV420DRAFT_1727301 [Desarmillaria tabescens]
MTDLNIARVMSLSGRVGLVTGGGTGIGLTIAKAFAANGVKVYITGRRLDVLEKAAASVTGVPGSVVPWMRQMKKASRLAQSTSKESMESSISLSTMPDFPASAHDPDFFTKKYAAEDPFEPETVQNWADIFAINTIAPFFVVHAFQSLLIKGARSRPQGTSSVINISACNSKVQHFSALYLAYSSTKAALEKLTLVLGTSFAERNIPIRVNVLAPGVFASDVTSTEFLELLKTKPLPGMTAAVPAKRHGTEAEMGMTAVYLAASDYTNGTILSIDGGISLVTP